MINKHEETGMKIEAFLRNLILVLCVFFSVSNCQKVFAEQELTVSLVSKHFGNSDYNYNEVNPGIISYWYNSPKYYTFIGAYKNSHSRNTFLAGIGHEWQNFCFEYGYVSGYDNAKAAAQFCYRFNVYGYKFKLNAMPAKQFGIASSDVMSLQVSIPF